MREADQAGSQTAEASPSSDKPRTKPRFFRRVLGSLVRPPAHERDAWRVASMCRALLSERGEVSGTRLAAEVLGAWRSLTEPARDSFFSLLADEFSPDPADVGRVAGAYRDDPSPANLIRLQVVVEAARQELFRRLNLAPGGTSALIEMRRQLLHTLDRHPERIGVDADFVHLFRSWFNGGFLVLQQIEWRTSAVILERLIQYEAVHQIQGWRDLRRRLEADRRCYAFFHPALPDDPLIFIEVALTRRMSARVQPLLDPDSVVVDPAAAHCAIFYSITNCQEGLRGVSFGNFLIKKVVEDLMRRFPRLRTFATLSPIPGFRQWLEASASSPVGDHTTGELAALVAKLGSGDALAARAIRELRRELKRSCAYYLLHARHGKEPLDPVARFHLANGARLERLNWLGDLSETGMRRSFGLMANYVYRLADMEQNHEAYAKEGRIIASHKFERRAKRSSLGRSGDGHA
jgi:malonyl-CoA decarboxylase